MFLVFLLFWCSIGDSGRRRGRNLLSSSVSIAMGASMSQSFYENVFQQAIVTDGGEIFVASGFNRLFTGFFNDQLNFSLDDLGAFDVTIIDVVLYDFANNVTVVEAGVVNDTATTEETAGETTTTEAATSSTSYTNMSATIGSSSAKFNGYTNTWESVAIVTLCVCLGIGFGMTFFSFCVKLFEKIRFVLLFFVLVSLI